MWTDCEKNSDVIWYCESQCERNSSYIVTHIVRELWGNYEWRWIPLMSIKKVLVMRKYIRGKYFSPCGKEITLLKQTKKKNTLRKYMFLKPIFSIRNDYGFCNQRKDSSFFSRKR